MESTLDLQILTHLEVLLRLTMAGVIGGAIGYERETNNHSAGLRTNMLVAIGSCLMMIISIKMHQLYPRTDPSRIVAQVVSGIGFLGAGTIITKSDNIKGLTTAATLWVNAGIGMATGMGLYFSAAMASGLVLVVLIVLGKINLKRD